MPIEYLQIVSVPVSSQDQAREFYVDGLGWDLLSDESYERRLAGRPVDLASSALGHRRSRNDGVPDRRGWPINATTTAQHAAVRDSPGPVPGFTRVGGIFRDHGRDLDHGAVRRS